MSILSSSSLSVESQSVDKLSTSTPPIDSSASPVEPQTSASVDAVNPNSIKNYEVRMII